jgi:rsbT co-antagonist protein RsbR
MSKPRSGLKEFIQRHEAELLKDWLETQLRASNLRRNLLDERQLRHDSERFLELLKSAALEDTDVHSGPSWGDMRELLSELSRQRAALGSSPSETATFVFSFKEPLFALLRRELAADPMALAEETWQSSLLLDKLGLYTTEVYQKGREAMIARQQQEMLELSTPVVELWSGILALPLIGTLDSERTQVVMESLLERIVETGSDLAIIDITGVPTVDTLVAQHLLKTVAAARLMGAECIISGIRPQIAQTIVHLGVELHGIITKATLSSAFAIALERRKLRIVGEAEA